MSAALAEAVSDTETAAPPTSNIVPLARHATLGGLPVPAEVIDEARAGAERLMRMPPHELRALIEKRVRMLDTELREREARRAAIEEALVAQRVLDVRRRRARRLRRKVNIGSSLVAAMFTSLIVVNMF